MKVLITGATGFVGSHTAEHLLEQGHEVRALARPSSNLVWLEDTSIEVVHGNMLDPASLETALKSIDAVVHIAGATAARNKQAFFEANHLATRGLLEAAKLYAPNLDRFLYISSQTAGGPSLDTNPVTEETPPHPITTYGKSKLAAENEARHYREYFPTTILRLPAIYGPRDTGILTFFQTVAKGIKPLIGFNDKFVNLLHVRDVAHGIQLALTKPAALNRTFYIGSEEQYGWRELSDLAAEILGKRGIFVRVPHAVVSVVAGISEFASLFKKKPSVLNWEKRMDITQQHWTLSIERARHELGFIPQIPIDQGFRDTISWYKKHGWLS
jgi:nucleoside-diphosphate-sugar epimerase